jgi:ATP-binding cassette subfamily F protein 3
MDQLATRVLELKNGVLTSYLGNYSEYIAKIAEESKAQEEIATPTVTYHKSREQKRMEAEERNKLSRLKKEVLEPLAKLEASISSRENELAEMERLLADNSIYSDHRHREYIQKYETLKKLLEREFQEWEELQRRKLEVEATT